MDFYSAFVGGLIVYSVLATLVLLGAIVDAQERKQK